MATYYVRLTGNDSTGTGATGAPWRTIQKALNSVPSGGGHTIKVGAGLYGEHLKFNVKDIYGNYVAGTVASGVSGSPNVLEAETATKPEIRVNGSYAMQIRTLNYWTFKNFRVTGTGAGINVDATGAAITGLIFDGIEFIGLTQLADSVSNAHTMIFVSASATNAVSYCTIQNCLAEKVYTGVNDKYNENFTNAGNVHHMLYLNNTVRKCTYIAFDCIGQGPAGVGSNLPTYSNLKPHHIIYHGNVVQDMIPAKQSTGVGIYNDGGESILIQNNTVTGCSGIIGGIEPWNDSGISLSRYIVRNNTVIASSASNNVIACQVGCGGNGMGSSYEAIPDKTAVYHNVLIGGTTAGAFLLMRATNAKIKNNIIGNGTGLTQWLYYKSEPLAGFTTGNESDANLFIYDATNERFHWYGDNLLAPPYFRTFAGYKTYSGQDANSQIATPIWAENYTLQATSPGYEEATHLTNAVGAGASSTSLTVTANTAWMFCDGWGLIGADVIEIEQSSGDPVERTVTAIVGDIITLDSAASWPAGAKIWAKDGFHVGLAGVISSGEDGGGEELPPPPPPPSGQELTNNGDFSQGSAGWLFHTSGSATCNFTGGKAEIDVSADGGNTQLYQYGLAIENGKTYTIRLTANSNDGGAETVSLAIHLQDSPWTALGFFQDVSIPTTESTQDFTFVATGGSTDARLRLSPRTGADLSINALQLLAGTGDPPSGGSDADETTVSSTDDYYIENSGGFGENNNPSFVGDWRSTPFANYDYGTGWIFVLDKAIPSDATITAAALTITSGGLASGATIAPIKIQIENAGDPAKPTSQADAAGRTYTTGVNWTPSTWTAANAYTSPDLTTDVQSVIAAQSGLALGANVHVRVIDQNAGFDAYRLMYISTAAANLYIAWEVPTAGGGATGGGLTTIRPGLRTGLRSAT